MCPIAHLKSLSICLTLHLKSILIWPNINDFFLQCNKIREMQYIERASLVEIYGLKEAYPISLRLVQTSCIWLQICSSLHLFINADCCRFVYVFRQKFLKLAFAIRPRNKVKHFEIEICTKPVMILYYSFNSKID